jgi:hypothetical protein
MVTRKMRRDNFLQPTIETLRLRVATRCSNPACRAPTAGPVMEKTKVSNIGQAAHITAAAPGGPRYDADMTPEERMGIDNGIWLCQNCATKVDRDPERYTVALLKSWKAEAESIALQEQGRPISVISERPLFQAGLFKKPIQQFVSSAVASMAETMMRIDPRITVEAHLTSSHATFVCRANEPVSFTMNVMPAFQSEFHAKLQAFTEHGEPIVMETSAVHIEGSALLELLNDQAETLSIGSIAKKSAIQKIFLRDQSSDTYFAMDDFIGEIIGGTKSFTFDGRALNGLCQLRYRFEFADQGGRRRDNPIEWIFNYDVWQGRPVRQLPYFDKLFRFFEVSNNDWTSSWTLEVEGNEVLKASGRMSLGDQVHGDYTMLHYIRNVRELSKLLGIDVPYVKTSISGKDMVAVHDLWAWLCDRPRRVGQDLGDFKTKLAPQTKAEAALLRDKAREDSGVAIKLERQFDQPFNLLGTYVMVNPVTMCFSSMKISIDGDVDVRPRKTVGVLLKPEEACRFSVFLSVMPYVLAAPPA